VVHGWHGKYLRIDLSTGRAEEVQLPIERLRALVGGVGLGAWLLLRHSSAGGEALAPEAPLVVALSPLVGTPLTTSAKFAVVAKSPLTGRICDALASDRFAIELKGCGLDALVLTGRWPECRCANVCLWTRFQQTYDYANRQVSRNRAQTQLEPDGSFRMILAHEDPGLPNWIDTEGRLFGMVFWRFMLPQTEEIVTPKAERVPFASLKQR